MHRRRGGLFPYQLSFLVQDRRTTEPCQHLKALIGIWDFVVPALKGSGCCQTDGQNPQIPVTMMLHVNLLINLHTLVIDPPSLN